MIGLSIAVVSLLQPSSDTIFHCGSAISHILAQTNFWFCTGKLFVYKSPSSDKISRASGQLFHIQAQT